MNAQEYIQSRLDELNTSTTSDTPINPDDLVATIDKLLMSKKFRKYAASPELQKHVKESIEYNVSRGDPINITFLHGAYKLWRLDESPEADWAELFALMYYTKWVKQICEIYKPGVWFDLFVDDLIIPVLDNIEVSDVNQYLDSYEKLLDFLKPYQPKNLYMTIHTVGDQFATPKAFSDSLERNVEEMEKNIGLPVLTDSQKAMIELNTRTTEKQLTDPQWKEKIFLIHNAYSATKAEPGYHKNRKDKILAFTQSLPMAIAVGSTKASIMKFWIGVGVLQIMNDNFKQIILSPNQLLSTEYDWQDVSIEGLEGKNFKKIRLVR